MKQKLNTLKNKNNKIKNKFKNKNKNKIRDNNKIKRVLSNNNSTLLMPTTTKITKLAFTKVNSKTPIESKCYKGEYEIQQINKYIVLVANQNEITMPIHPTAEEIKQAIIYITIVYSQENQPEATITLSNNNLNTYIITNQTRLITLTDIPNYTMKFQKSNALPVIIQIAIKTKILHKNQLQMDIIDVKPRQNQIDESMQQEISNVVAKLKFDEKSLKSKLPEYESEEEEEEDEDGEEQTEELEEEQQEQNDSMFNLQLKDQNIKTVNITVSKQLVQEVTQPNTTKLANKIVIAYNNQQEKVLLYYYYDGKTRIPIGYKIITMNELNAVNFSGVSLISTKTIKDMTVNEFQATITLI